MKSSDKLRVLYSFPMRLGDGAVGAAALQTIKLLSEAGHEVEVFCGDGAAALPDHKVTETRRAIGIYLPQKLTGRRVATFLHDRLVARRLKTMNPKPDVVHVWPRSCLATIHEARIQGVLSVREAPNCHTEYAQMIVAREHERLGVPLGGTHKPDPRGLALEVREYAAADIILAPSAFARETFLERGVQESKIRMHSYGFDPKRFKGLDRADMDAPVTFGFIASCEPRKGLHYALEAWRKSGVAEKTRFLVLGKFFAGYLDALSELLDHPNVSIMGHISDLAPVYGEIDALVLPSIEEGSALVTYEAQAMSCALLVSKAAGARMTDGEQGFLHDTGDVDALALQMRRVVEDRPLLRRLQLAARDNAQNLTWENALNDLVDSYGSGLKSLPAPPAKPQRRSDGQISSVRENH